MTTRHIQWMIAAVFFVLGGWALVAPRSVIALTLLPEHQIDAPILPFVVACFGAQAMISGLFAAFAGFTFVEPVFTMVGLLDAVGNVVMLGLCAVGWRKAKAVETAPLPRHRSQQM